MEKEKQIIMSCWLAGMSIGQMREAFDNVFPQRPLTNVEAAEMEPFLEGMENLVERRASLRGINPNW